MVLLSVCCVDGVDQSPSPLTTDTDHNIFTCNYTRIIDATNQFTSPLHIEDAYVDKSSSTTVLLTLWTIVLGCYTSDNNVVPRVTLLCVLSIYMMHAIYSIDLYDVRYTCYRSVTMHDMLSIYDAISTIHSIIMVLYTTCYLSMRWVIYILSILWCCMLCA